MAQEEPILEGGPAKVFELLERADGPDGDGAAAYAGLIEEAKQQYKSLSEPDKQRVRSDATHTQLYLLGVSADMDLEGGRKKRRKTKKPRRKTSTRRSASRRSLRRLGSR